MYYVYVLGSENFDQSYIGMTDDLKGRLKDHDSGKSSHTAKFKPWKIICYFAFTNKKVAANFEQYLKSGSGRAFARKHF